jgi:RNA polymerase sigma factor (sigma-70 family)
LDDFQRELIELLPRLRRFARALTRHAADADDLVQLAVERALERRDQWSPGTRLDAWVMRIMKNAWIDEARSRRRKLSYLRPADERVEARDLAASNPEVGLDRLSVEDAMNALPEDQRIAVALVLIEGYSYAEAAELLQIPPGTLTSRLVRGRTALIKQLELEGVQP